MTQEEKARAYDKAIKRAKEINNEQKAQPFDVMLKVFPELKESEDERIKEEITELVMQPTWKTEKEFHRRKELCAWLEKQGEQKPQRMISAEAKEALYDKPAEISDTYNLTEFESALADVCRGWIGEEIGWKDYIVKNSLPLLEIANRQLYKEQKPAEWSEEDETRLTNIIIMLKEGASLHFIKDDIRKGVDWLKSLKDRAQPKQEWQPKVGDTFKKKGTEKPLFHLCCENEDCSFSFVQEMEDGIAGGAISLYSLQKDYEPVNTLQEVIKDAYE